MPSPSPSPSPEPSRSRSLSRVPLLLALALGLGALGLGGALALRSGTLVKWVSPKPLAPEIAEPPPATVEVHEPHSGNQDEERVEVVLEPWSVGARAQPLESPSLTPRQGIGTGTLYIESTPRARVFIDRMELQRSTPVRQHVWAGRHRIGLRGPSGVLHEFAMEVVEGEETHVNKDLRLESVVPSQPPPSIVEVRDAIDAVELPACTANLQRSYVGSELLSVVLVVLDGVVDSAQVEHSRGLSVEDEQCVLNQMLEWHFPEGRSGRVSVPFRASERASARRTTTSQTTDKDPW